MRFPPCLQSISSQRSETGHTRHEIFQLQNYRNQTCGASLEYNLPFRIEFNHVRVRPVHLHPPLQPTARRRVEDISTKMTSRSIGTVWEQRSIGGGYHSRMRKENLANLQDGQSCGIIPSVLLNRATSHHELHLGQESLLLLDSSKTDGHAM